MQECNAMDAIMCTQDVFYQHRGSDNNAVPWQSAANSDRRLCSPAWPAGAARDKESNDSQLNCSETPWGWEFAIPALWQLGEGSPRVRWWCSGVVVPPQEEQEWGEDEEAAVVFPHSTVKPNCCPQSANSLPLILFKLTRELASHSEIPHYFSIKCKIFQGSSLSPPEKPKLSACKSLSKPLMNWQNNPRAVLGNNKHLYWWLLMNNQLFSRHFCWRNAFQSRPTQGNSSSTNVERCLFL